MMQQSLSAAGFLRATLVVLCGVLACLMPRGASAQDVVITVRNVPYRITTQSDTFNNLYGTGADISTPASAPWWGSVDVARNAALDYLNYLTTNSIAFPGTQPILFAYGVTGGAASNFRAAAARPPSYASTNAGRVTDGNRPRNDPFVFAHAVQIPEIDGAVLGRVVMSLGVLHLCLLGLKRRRPAV